MLAVLRNTLYIYGGIYERGSREYTLDDFYSIQLDKLDRYTCLKESSVLIPEGGEDDSSDGDEEDDDDESEDEDTDEATVADDVNETHFTEEPVRDAVIDLDKVEVVQRRVEKTQE